MHPRTYATSKSSWQAHREQLEVSKSVLQEFSTRTAMSLGCTGKAAALSFSCLKTTPVASHAFSKQSTHPPTLYAHLEPIHQFYPSLAVSPLQVEQNPFLQGRREHVWATLPFPAAKAPTASGNASSWVQVSCKALPSLRKHRLWQGPEKVSTDAACSVLAGSNRLFQGLNFYFHFLEIGFIFYYNISKG